ncbi:MAG TPA: HAD-IA family hydrolase [Pseudonocardiaceae bacterium]|jgi:putative hydrolase of the HAD superfamily|nr:HAD-IA family hydrolase [Pseudonocardiaceae bacterium]
MRWVVFDFGEVIGLRTKALPTLAARIGAPAEEFAEVYWEHRDAYDRDSDDLGYWRRLGAPFGVEVEEALSAELTEIDCAGWLHAVPETVALIAELAQAGVALAVLSNAPSSFGRAVEQQPWAKYFRHLLFSGDLGVAKPDREIWAALLARLDAAAADCLFVDDRQVNVDGALAAGLRAAHWHSAGAVRPRLVEFGVLAEDGRAPSTRSAQARPAVPFE